MLKVVVENNITPALDKYADRLVSVISEGLGDASRLVIGRAIGDYMRDIVPGEPKRRSPDDAGPLRIVTGRLARGLTGARKGGQNPESIYRFETSPGEYRLTFGTRVPYAAIHEFGGMAGRGHKVHIPGRPYLGPALQDETPTIVNLFDQKLQQLATEVGL